jgi:hypothetical protein
MKFKRVAACDKNAPAAVAPAAFSKSLHFNIPVTYPQWNISPGNARLADVRVMLKKDWP